MIRRASFSGIERIRSRTVRAGDFGFALIIVDRAGKPPPADRAFPCVIPDDLWTAGRRARAAASADSAPGPFT